MNALGRYCAAHGWIVFTAQISNRGGRSLHRYIAAPDKDAAARLFDEHSAAFGVWKPYEVRFLDPPRVGLQRESW